MVKIDSFYFGNIIINGRKFQRDVVISWNGEINERDGSHIFTKADYNEIMLRDPEVIVIGTGIMQNVKVDPSVEVAAKMNGVEIIAKPTMVAIEEFNKLVKKKKVIGVIHLTC